MLHQEYPCAEYTPIGTKPRQGSGTIRTPKPAAWIPGALLLLGRRRRLGRFRPVRRQTNREYETALFARIAPLLLYNLAPSCGGGAYGFSQIRQGKAAVMPAGAPGRQAVAARSVLSRPGFRCRGKCPASRGFRYFRGALHVNAALRTRSSIFLFNSNLFVVLGLIHCCTRYPVAV